MITQAELNSAHYRLMNELPFYARHTAKIKDKRGQIVPFIFNNPQEYLHKEIEAQLADKGWVRIIIVKGRQEGCSTYIALRFYHKATTQEGKSVFILSHEAQTTAKLFGMVDRFQQNAPAPMRPATDLYNKRQIVFTGLNSEYTVGTAGNEDVGRGGTLQYFHGSEVAFWEKTDGIETGIMQSVADVAGTEIILESTANGMGNMFYDKCMQALKGKGDYKLVFIPWYWMEDYRRQVPLDFAITEEEELLAKQFGLDNEQIYWRRKKIEEFKSLWKFRQEYPMTVQDAFVTSGASLIDKDKVLAARKADVKDVHSPLIVGVDCGRTNDRTVLAFRRGREVTEIRTIDPRGESGSLTDQMHIAGKIANAIRFDNVAKVFIDSAQGYGVYDRLRELGYAGIVTSVNFSHRPNRPDLYLNKRAEIYLEMRDWFEDGGVSIPDEEEIQVDLSSLPDYKETSRGLAQMVAKDEIKKLLGRSPDIADAIALTFAYPVARDINLQLGARINVKKKGKGQSPLKTMNRVRKVKSSDNAEIFYNSNTPYWRSLNGSGKSC